MTLLMNPDRRKRVAAFYGGVGFGAQLNALRHGVDVAVACPGRLVDLVGRGAMSLADVSFVVIDEADRMADMGFLPEVKRILDQVRPDRQTLLFSATLDGEVDVLVRRYQRSPVKVSVDTDLSNTLSTTHHWVDTRREDRVALAAHYVSAHGSTVLFCRTKHGTDRVARQLVAAGVKAVPIHGDRTQSQRDRALAAFSSGRVQALVATDVAARGIHVDGVQCVVHFDLPATDKDYLHRSGRTGRAGADGMVISFVTQADTSAVRTLQKALDHPLSPKWGSQGFVTELPVGSRPVPATTTDPDAGRASPAAPARPSGPPRRGPRQNRYDQPSPSRQRGAPTGQSNWSGQSGRSSQSGRSGRSSRRGRPT
jgi:superfamily II DNA/RNA helicase